MNCNCSSSCCSSSELIELQFFSNASPINAVTTNSTITSPSGTLVRDIIASLDTSDAMNDAIALKVNKTIYDLQTPLHESGKAEIIYLSSDSPDARLVYRHSFSHILAQAVLRLFPDAQLAIGPATDSGFYYDFDMSHSLCPEDLDRVSSEMQKIIKENAPFVRTELTLEQARKRFQDIKAQYKLELLDEIEKKLTSGETVTIYENGDFVDLCRGPHMKSTGQVQCFKLLELAGAYWRGDEQNQMLQRVYGTAFQTKEALERHVWEIEEAKKRDHRKLGKELSLFSILPDEIGSGLVLWHPKSGLIRYLVEAHCKKRHLREGYEFVITPHIGRSTLWQTSGHLDFYKEGMFPAMEIDGQEYYIKPMNCPFHVHIYKSQVHSYRELPLRFAEWGTVYRYERSGAMHGLTRARGFTQDDAHLFCSPEQMPSEIDKVLAFSISILKDFGLDTFHLYLSTRPEKSVGDDDHWKAAESALEDALKRSGHPYSVNAGDGAFYGPKIDICVFDAIGRQWQLSTIQFDFNLPERFDMTFVGQDGEQHRPYMIHRALLGSMERFFGILVEHFGGAFPLWLAPTQAVILPIAERHYEYAQTVLDKLRAYDLRAEIDGSSNTLSYRIRNAQKQKIPFMLVVGDKEQASEQIAVRTRTSEDLGAMSIDALMERIKDVQHSPAK